MDLVFNESYAPMWTAVGTIASSIASIMAIAALIYSMTSYSKSLRVSHYSELDSMYFELLKSVIEKPHLYSFQSNRLGDQVVEYNTYAFMVWNFLEAIYDRCANDKNLRATWYPVIDEESRKHREWFDHPDNHHKFKNEFHQFIGKGLFAVKD